MESQNMESIGMENLSIGDTRETEEIIKTVKKPVNQAKKFIHNPKFGNEYEISPAMQNYLDSLKSQVLMRYGLSIFSSKFVFGENHQNVLDSIYNKSLRKLGESPNSMHKYGAGDVITIECMDKIKSSLLGYIYEVFGIDPCKKCYLFTDFSVHYGSGYGYDHKLDEHVDDSEITINICLKNTQDYTGLRFKQIPDTLFSFKNDKSIFVNMEEGDILIHSGKQRHEVVQNSKPNSGERVNLILWLKFIH